MKPVGLLGGTSWVSTTHYYEKLNRAYQQKLGGLHSAPMLIHSVDFAPIAKAQANEDWITLGRILADNARGLEQAGAGSITIGANTMHMCFDAVQSAIDIPVLHIADGIAAEIKDQPTLLLGTAYTMQKPFLLDRLRALGCDIHLPEAVDQERIHRIIFDDLCQDRVPESARIYFGQLAEQFEGNLLLACTELGLVLEAGSKDANTKERIIDSLDCHVTMMLKQITI